ncbi:hypothetical protein LTR15_008754 [Elasticomyces elasticus]|nr:hypothetical protein LTR15_008754 [Elasticomyces elasticus]
MKFSTSTILAFACLAALSAAAPIDKEEQIENICRSNDFYKFHRPGGDNFMVYVGDVCVGGHLKSGLRLNGDRIEGPIHRKDGVETYGHEDKSDQEIKELCSYRGLGSDGYVTFDAHGRPDFRVKVEQVCDGDHLNPGLHLKGDHIKGPIHYKYGDKGNIDYLGN